MSSCAGERYDEYGYHYFWSSQRLWQFPVEVTGNAVYVRAAKQLLIDRDGFGR